MPRIKMRVAYEGTAYAGWQLQAGVFGKSPPTIQGKLEGAIAAITGSRLPVHGSGRTDAGVHAEGQVCHVDLPAEKAGLDWARALNALLPDDIRVLEAEAADDSFHARYSAKGKCYAYSLWMGGRERAVPRLRNFVWSVPPLDADRMRAAAAFLPGCRDFASLRNAGAEQGSTIRTLHSVELVPQCAGPISCPEDWPVATWFFRGDGFLKQMVRNLTGLLVWVGQGKIAPEDVPGLLAAKDRRALPSPAAPARGLTLMWVEY